MLKVDEKQGLGVELKSDNLDQQEQSTNNNLDVTLNNLDQELPEYEEELDDGADSQTRKGAGRWKRPHKVVDIEVLVYYHLTGKFPQDYKKSLRSYYNVTYIKPGGTKHAYYLEVCEEYNRDTGRKTGTRATERKLYATGAQSKILPLRREGLPR